MTTALFAQPQLDLAPLASFRVLDPAMADALLTAWGHYLGPCERPFGRQDFALAVDGAVVCVATSASAVSSTVASFRRDEVVELARLCRAPDAPWATRVCLRLWREVGAPRWPYWKPRAYTAYSQRNRHDGDVYRFDGWRRVEGRHGSSGGGTWTKERGADHQARGPKDLWIYEPPHEEPRCL